jgi:hypothetical protein
MGPAAPDRGQILCRRASCPQGVQAMSSSTRSHKPFRLTRTLGETLADRSHVARIHSTKSLCAPRTCRLTGGRPWVRVRSWDHEPVRGLWATVSHSGGPRHDASLCSTAPSGVFSDSPRVSHPGRLYAVTLMHPIPSGPPARIESDEQLRADIRALTIDDTETSRAADRFVDGRRGNKSAWCWRWLHIVVDKVAGRPSRSPTPSCPDARRRPPPRPRRGSGSRGSG